MSDFFSNLDINKLVGNETSPNLGWNPYQTGNNIPTGSGRVDNLPSTPSASDPASMMQEQLNQQNQSAQPTVVNPNAPHGETSTTPVITMKDIDLNKINYNDTTQLNALINAASNSVTENDRAFNKATIDNNYSLQNDFGEAGLKFMIKQFNPDGSMSKTPRQLANAVAEANGVTDQVNSGLLARLIEKYANDYKIPQVAAAAILSQHLTSETGIFGWGGETDLSKGGSWFASDIGFKDSVVANAMSQYSNRVNKNTKGEKVDLNSNLSKELQNYMDRYNTNLSFKKAQVNTINEAREVQKLLALRNSRMLDGKDLTRGELATLAQHIQLLKAHGQLYKDNEIKLQKYLAPKQNNAE